MELPFLVKTCDLFVYLNVHFRSYQFEEVQSRARERTQFDKQSARPSPITKFARNATTQ